MRISHEAIYQSLYIESRGALKRELVCCLRRAGRYGCRGRVHVEDVGACHARDVDQPAARRG